MEKEEPHIASDGGAVRLARGSETSVAPIASLSKGIESELRRDPARAARKLLIVENSVVDVT